MKKDRALEQLREDPERTDAEIARAIGSSRELVRQVRAEAGVERFRPFRGVPGLKRRVLELVSAGSQVSDAAAEVGVSGAAVTKWRSHDDGFAERLDAAKEVALERRLAFPTCTRCGETKEASEFRRDSSRVGGRQATCLMCNRKATARHRARSSVGG